MKNILNSLLLVALTVVLPGCRQTKQQEIVEYTVKIDNSAPTSQRASGVIQEDLEWNDEDLK